MKLALSYPNQTLNQLYTQANWQVALLAKIKSVLPVEVADHALHCVVSKRTLLVNTDSATWASQLRFCGEAMLAAANIGTTQRLSAVKVKVLPAFERREQKRKRNLPSPATVRLIADNSQAVQDPGLKASLVKLSVTLTRLHQENDQTKKQLKQLGF